MDDETRLKEFVGLIKEDKTDAKIFHKNSVISYVTPVSIGGLHTPRLNVTARGGLEITRSQARGTLRCFRAVKFQRGGMKSTSALLMCHATVLGSFFFLKKKKILLFVKICFPLLAFD